MRSLLVLLLSSLAIPAFAQPSIDESIYDYFGTWQLVSFEKADPPPARAATEEMAKQQIGKQFSITPETAGFDKGLFEKAARTCKSPGFNRRWSDDFTGLRRQVLLPEGHALKREAGVLYFDVRCGRNTFLGFEVTADGKASIFHRGYFFLFRKLPDRQN